MFEFERQVLDLFFLYGAPGELEFIKKVKELYPNYDNDHINLLRLKANIMSLMMILSTSNDIPHYGLKPLLIKNILRSGVRTNSVVFDLYSNIDHTMGIRSGSWSEESWNSRIKYKDRKKNIKKIIRLLQ